MSRYKAIETEIKGLLIIEPTVQIDNGDFFVEEDLKQDLLEIGIDVEFVHENSFKIARGVLRGLHFQRKQTQGRLVRVTAGAILNVSVDLRPESYTYGASCSVEMSTENQRMVWVPEQFANGFMTLEANTEITIKCTDFDNPKAVSGLLWRDSIVSIDWEFERYDIDEKYLNVSDRDKNLPSFRSWNPLTIWK